MATTESPKHRRIYVIERIRRIHTEIKALKAERSEKPDLDLSERAGINRHREFVFNKLRTQELRKELSALKLEAKTFPKKGSADGPA